MLHVKFNLAVSGFFSLLLVSNIVCFLILLLIDLDVCDCFGTLGFELVRFSVVFYLSVSAGFHIVSERIIDIRLGFVLLTYLYFACVKNVRF